MFDHACRYNSHLTYPTINNVLNFPLIQGISSTSATSVASSNNVLLALLDAVFNDWVRPQAGSMWFAAGFKVLAFEALSVQTVAVIEVDPAVSLGLFADAVCSFPPPKSSGPSDFCFLYAELGITCQLNLRDGLFLAEAKLSPKSFILHPSCHLLGGFALGYWFNPSLYAGNFVFTVSLTFCYCACSLMRFVFNFRLVVITLLSSVRHTIQNLQDYPYLGSMTKI